MKPLNPLTILLTGFLLVSFGFVVPFLMVIRVIEPGFALSFLAYAAQVSGIFLGLIGAALLQSKNRL